MNHEIIYLYDPLCGWCYGFSPVIRALRDQIGKDIPFTALAGGMVTGERVGPVGQVAPYIKTAFKRVEDLSGVRFGGKFLEMMETGGATIFDSEPPSRAAYILKDAYPDAAIDIAHGVQDIIYKEGQNPNLATSYHKLASGLGMDTANFDEHFESHGYRLAIQDEFTLVKRFGVTGFPTVVYRNKEQYYLVSNGFTELEALNNALKAIQQEVGKPENPD